MNTGVEEKKDSEMGAGPSSGGTNNGGDSGNTQKETDGLKKNDESSKSKTNESFPDVLYNEPSNNLNITGLLETNEEHVGASTSEATLEGKETAAGKKEQNEKELSVNGSDSMDTACKESNLLSPQPSQPIIVADGNAVTESTKENKTAPAETAAGNSDETIHVPAEEDTKMAAITTLGPSDKIAKTGSTEEAKTEKEKLDTTKSESDEEVLFLGSHKPPPEETMSDEYLDKWLRIHGSLQNFQAHYRNMYDVRNIPYNAFHDSLVEIGNMTVNFCSSMCRYGAGPGKLYKWRRIFEYDVQSDGEPADLCFIPSLEFYDKIPDLPAKKTHLELATQPGEFAKLSKISDTEHDHWVPGSSYMLYLLSQQGDNARVQSSEPWLKITKSTIPKAGRGLFAARTFHKGETVGFYGGKMTWHRKQAGAPYRSKIVSILFVARLFDIP